MSNPSQPSIDPTKTLSYNQILMRMLAISLLCFITGVLVTMAWVYVNGYHKLPLQGEMQIQANGEPVFVPFYRLFYRYAIRESTGVAPTESYLDQIGPIGNGVFFYGTVNAPHWIFELQVNNLRGMIAIPLLILVGGLYLFVRFLLPKHQQTANSLFNYSIIICVLHSIWVMTAVIVGYFMSEPYSRLYQNYNFYGGQFVGVLIPAVAIVLLYALFLGAILGSLFSLKLRTQASSAQPNSRKSPIPGS